MEWKQTLLPLPKLVFNTLNTGIVLDRYPLTGCAEGTEEITKMGILAWIVVGIIAGFLAKVVVPGEGPGGILGDLIVGVLGALIGGFVAGMFGIASSSIVMTTVIAFVGAVILLFVLRAVTGRRNTA
jgi:uncharacterized membrane protein YeaQ/YmgE (transglycosylase-associated protein family)